MKEYFYSRQQEQISRDLRCSGIIWVSIHLIPSYRWFPVRKPLTEELSCFEDKKPNNWVEIGGSDLSQGTTQFVIITTTNVIAIKKRRSYYWVMSAYVFCSSYKRAEVLLLPI